MNQSIEKDDNGGVSQSRMNGNRNRENFMATSKNSKLDIGCDSETQTGDNLGQLCIIDRILSVFLIAMLANNTSSEATPISPGCFDWWRHFAKFESVL